MVFSLQALNTTIRNAVESFRGLDTGLQVFLGLGVVAIVAFLYNVVRMVAACRGTDGWDFSEAGAAELSPFAQKAADKEAQKREAQKRETQLKREAQLKKEAQKKRPK